MDNMQLRRCWEQIWCQYVQIRLWVGTDKHIHDYGNLCFLQRPSNDGTSMRLASIFLHSDIVLTPYPPVTKLCNPNPTICTYLFYHKNMFLLFPLWNIFCTKKHAEMFPSFFGIHWIQSSRLVQWSRSQIRILLHSRRPHMPSFNIAHGKIKSCTNSLPPNMFFTKQNVKNPQFLKNWCKSFPSINLRHGVSWTASIRISPLQS